MGYNGKGQLGDGTTTSAGAPEQIVSGGVTAIVAGGFFDGQDSLFLRSDGSLWAMGYNLYGQLGDGTTTDSHIPKQIACSSVTAMAAGLGHTLFVKSDGSLWGMGYNYGGQLGNGTTTDSHVPVQIVGGTTVAGGPICGMRITGVAKFGSYLQLSFPSEFGHTYTVLSTSELVSSTWTPLQTGIPGNGATMQVTVPYASDQAHQFFRIQAQ